MTNEELDAAIEALSEEYACGLIDYDEMERRYDALMEEWSGT